MLERSGHNVHEGLVMVAERLCPSFNVQHIQTTEREEGGKNTQKQQPPNRKIIKIHNNKGIHFFFFLLKWTCMCSLCIIYVRGPYLRVLRKRVSQKVDPVRESSLQKRQDEGEHSKNVVPAVVHETAEETQLFTGGLHFHQIIQSEGKTQNL